MKNLRTDPRAFNAACDELREEQLNRYLRERDKERREREQEQN